MTPPTPACALIIGSAPDAERCRNWPRGAFTHIVAINNAWRLREDWDYHIAPDDFPSENHPQGRTPAQSSIGSDAYVPANNRYGGVFYAGGTMAFTAGYWALDALRPRVLAFVGCDMIYAATGKTHFYGTGTADPLRVDPSLRNLEAKSARLRLHAAQQGCACVRLSAGESRLAFDRSTPAALETAAPPVPAFDASRFQAAKDRETALRYHAPSGRYWEVSEAFSTAEIDALDALWLAAAPPLTDV